MIDLHIHTSASADGVHSPAEIFDMASRLGLEAVAFADHNTIGSVSEGMKLAAESGIRFITGIELNSFHEEHDLHLLAYGFDLASNEVMEWLKQIVEAKWEQSRGRFENLRKMGFVLDWEDLVRDSENRPPSGMNFVRTMLARRENDSDSRLDPYRPGGSRADSPYLNFYLDYLRGGKPAFYPQEGVSTIGMIEKVLSLDAIPVLAHPSDTPDAFIPPLIGAGLRGMEVYSSYHDAKLAEKWLGAAKYYNLLITAGSDFHGASVKPDVQLGRATSEQSLPVPPNNMALFDRLIAALPHTLGVV